MSKLRLFVWESDERILLNTSEFDCVVCGMSHFPLRVGCMLYEPAITDLPRKKGDVCLYCLVAGQQAAAEQLRARVGGWKNLADEIEGMTEWATDSALQEASAAIAEVEALLE